MNGKQQNAYDHKGDHTTDFVLLDEGSIFIEEEYDFEGIKRMFKEIREILQMDYQRRMDIWHNGTAEEIAAVLEEDVEEYMDDNFGWKNYRLLEE